MSFIAGLILGSMMSKDDNTEIISSTVSTPCSLVDTVILLSTLILVILIITLIVFYAECRYLKNYIMGGDANSMIASSIIRFREMNKTDIQIRKDRIVRNIANLTPSEGIGIFERLARYILRNEIEAKLKELKIKLAKL